MKYLYPACFYDEGDGYSVIFPDFPCGTCGSDLREAHDMAVDFLYGQIIGFKEDKKKLPAPSDINSVQFEDDFEYKSAFKTLVAVDVKEYERFLNGRDKAVRKNVTVPLWLLEAAEKAHINFSKTLQDALRQQLNI